MMPLTWRDLLLAFIVGCNMPIMARGFKAWWESMLDDEDDN